MMEFETKEQALESMLSEGKPNCPHCGHEMSIWEVPPINFSDGLGWGSPYLFVCFNDECQVYRQGWANIQENYGRTASYRCMCYPDKQNFEYLPVFSPMGAQGQIIDNEALLEEEILKENIMKGFSILADCYVNKDSVTVTRLLLDPTEPMRVRLKAAEMIGDIGELEAIDPLRSHRFGVEKMQQSVEAAIAKIHDRYFTRECPFCAEIIKKRANVCKHCGKEVAGE